MKSDIPSLFVSLMSLFVGNGVSFGFSLAAGTREDEIVGDSARIGECNA